MRLFLTWLMLHLFQSGWAQISVGFHQSNLPFFSIGYEGKSRFVPELRIGLDNFFSSTTLEGVVLYQFVRKDDLTAYGGLGARVVAFEGAVVPFGLNVYPFAAKNFGFHLELAPIIGGDALLRGSGGIRYQFRKHQ